MDFARRQVAGDNHSQDEGGLHVKDIQNQQVAGREGSTSPPVSIVRPYACQLSGVEVEPYMGVPRTAEELDLLVVWDMTV